MTGSSYLGLAAFGTAITACWSYLQGFAARLRSLIVVNVIVTEEAAEAIQHLVWTQFTRSPIGDRFYSGRAEHVRPLNRTQRVAYELPGLSPIVFWRGWRPLLISRRIEYSGSNALRQREVAVTFLRGTYDFDRLLIDALGALNAYADGGDHASRFRVFRTSGNRLSLHNHRTAGDKDTAPTPAASENPLSQASVRVVGWKLSDLGTPSDERPFAGLAFPEEIDDAIEELKRWKASERWFREKRIPWRRGWLLYGPPGCGKTSLVRALAQQMDMPAFIFDLSTMTNEDMAREWNRMLSYAPCIALFEDIDGVFHGRENVHGEDGITFDCLLNCISGVEPAEGIFTVATTNDLTKIDPALGNPTLSGQSTRPGRLDRLVMLGAMDERCRRAVAKRILADNPSLIESTVDAGEGDTPAQFQERCAQLALSHYWRGIDRYHQLAL